MERFEPKVVLITGGTSGIGLALANAFLSEGHSTAVCGRSKEKLSAFEAAHPQALAIQADVTDTSSHQAMLDTARQRFGRIDVLVNNAGGLLEHDFGSDVPDSDALAREIALNLTAPIQITATALHLFPALSAIVFITSAFAFVSPRRSPTYGAAKAGLRAFAKGLRRQVGNRTQVFEVVPPSVDTPGVAHRNVKKISPDVVALETLKALSAGREEILVGEARLLPYLLRIAPRTVERIVAKR